ncbi:unnamed protein product [Trypanosoma congolense IL3000]|uniref:WGS project CAEQ00000000 data, annotated contig 102 n=1 Tax=Trypanosoma congolense (strain IL3000) TaxID=1068625 RepID=F9W3A5_TRYCI|nr:unnamed protein product [Trypanosoma congolense IL3000]
MLGVYFRTLLATVLMVAWRAACFRFHSQHMFAIYIYIFEGVYRLQSGRQLRGRCARHGGRLCWILPRPVPRVDSQHLKWMVESALVVVIIVKFSKTTVETFEALPMFSKLCCAGLVPLFLMVDVPYLLRPERLRTVATPITYRPVSVWGAR